MLLKKKTTSTPPIPEGVHLAVCTLFADLGTQETKFGTKDQIAIGWTVPGETIEVERDGKTVSVPRLISETFTATLNEKSNLTRILTGWRGRPFTPEEEAGFDPRNLLGQPCQLQIVHKQGSERTFANIANVIPLPKGTPKPQVEVDQVFFALDQLDEPELPDALPQWLADKVKLSPQWQKIESPPEPKVAPEDIIDLSKPAEDDDASF